MYEVDAEKLRQLIMKNGLNISDVAKKAGVQNATIKKLLDGGAVALLSTIGKIAGALNVDGDNLILKGVIK